ncbi:MAG TPA: tRNA pseudouridine(55) synthase TruB [Clostridiales bacterium]|jgi:tRNA pseudouridine55 synthase|nr:tRNA pseudouridine(55) synthase TruB [Clostridiales bacterium]
MTGFVNFLKPPKMSSAQAVAIIKKLSSGQKCGHMGTLDPFACGVLPIALGRATKLFDYFIRQPKTYRAVFKFGVETNTLDLDGIVTKKDDKKIMLEQIKAILPEFLGIISQEPPKYSAKRINGKRAYELARSGQEVNLKPTPVKIYNISAQDLGDNEFIFDICCSGGTYIRSLCRDIAYKLGTCSVMTCLIRQASGNFDITNAKTLDELEKDFDIIGCQDVLKDFNKCVIQDQKNYVLALNGADFKAMTNSNKTQDLAFYYNDKLLGIGQKTTDDFYKIKIRLI